MGWGGGEGVAVGCHLKAAQFLLKYVFLFIPHALSALLKYVLLF